MNWKTFKELVEKKLKSQKCENPDLAEIEGIDFSDKGFNGNSIEKVSYYEEGNSFYIVG